MKRTRHTGEKIIPKFKTAEQLMGQGKTVLEVCRIVDETQSTYQRWLKQYGGIQVEEARRLTPRFQESCHPCDQCTRGLEVMSNASLQQGRQV